ncbi:hypothetical protein Fcan01_25487 [Folsomia candida]|uniref:Uncharacterized protein n=1 Tax=Folsomia candida TaxID=158441 RepID=A0A226D3N9_FOLCA|nr:hypothetical protein Fcan01_25487 [Folsomia candida]
MENINDPKNRYIRANVTQKDSRGIIHGFPFTENNFSLIFSNCHIVIMFSPPANPLLLIWGMAAFNEDPDYVIIIDRYPGRLQWQFNYYFLHSSDFRLTSILLYSNMSSNALSVVCHTCTPPQAINDQNDESILLKKLFPIKDWTLTKFVTYYEQLMKNMNQHTVNFSPTRKFWKIPCSLKQCGLETPQTTCPVSEIRFRLNFTTVNSVHNIIGYAISNSFYSSREIREKFSMPGLVLRLTWIKHSIDFRKVQYTIYALPIELNENSLLKIFDALSFSILFIFGSCSSLLIFKNKKFIFAPVMWTVSIFLQQSTAIVIKPGEARVTRLRVFMAYFIVSIWLFNAFFVGSIFSGEFVSLFTSKRVPQVPRNLAEVVQAEELPMISFATTTNRYENNREVSSIKETIIPEMLRLTRYPSVFRKMLNDLKLRVEWLGNINEFRFAR